MRIKLHMLEINQSIGSFYVGKINSNVLIQISKTVRRNDSLGIQRELSPYRVKEISKYCEDPDSAFPTPIIVNIKGEYVEAFNPIEGIEGLYELVLDDSVPIAEILDGQHRVEGIKAAGNFNTDMMLVVMFDLTEEEKAYVFSTINSNQAKVNKSLIYDLFELSTKRSPYKTCHEIARIMNSDKTSPFYNRLKMLGKKGEDGSLSQGTFVTYLCRLISVHPQQDMIDIKNEKTLKDDDRLVLRKYFIEERDEIILKILHNYFSAVAKVFAEEWINNDNYILCKTTGYGALMKAFPALYRRGYENKTLSQAYFENEFEETKGIMKLSRVELTSTFFPSGEHGQVKLSKFFSKETGKEENMTKEIRNMNNKKPVIQASGYNGSEPTRVCPHCGKEKPISDFGYRKMENGEIRNQSWCKDCR